MKKSLITLIVLISFLLGNASMIVAVVKLFGEEAIKIAFGDLITQKVQTVLYGTPTPSQKGRLSGGYRHPQQTRLSPVCEHMSSTGQ